jgi:hypothetical protein
MRFGRGSAVVSWKHTDGIARDTLLVGAPGAYTHGTCQTGKIYAYALPLQIGPAGELPAPAWSILSPSFEPCAHFGASLVALRYNTSLVGQQFAVSGREETVGGLARAGRVYTYVAP